MAAPLTSKHLYKCLPPPLLKLLKFRLNNKTKVIMNSVLNNNLSEGILCVIFNQFL